jgi:ABC-type lipoprotein export system ATPase subunit
MDTTTVTPLYDLRAVRKTYGSGDTLVTAVAGIDLRIRGGEFVVIAGPSGSGKTTLLQLLGALDRPTDGEILFEGQDLNRSTDNALAKLRRETLGFVFQQFNLIPTLTAQQNVEAAMPDRTGAERRGHARELLERVGLGHRLGNLPTQLSGGEQQRTAIARALVHDPVILIADEPTGNLDPVTSWEIIQLLIQINALGTTVLMATHNQEIVNAMRRRVLALENGHLVRDEATAAYEREY